MTNRTSTSTMIYLDEVVATDPLRCDHASGEVSMRITSGETTTWLVGTPTQWRAFANHIANLTDEIVRDEPVVCSCGNDTWLTINGIDECASCGRHHPAIDWSDDHSRDLTPSDGSWADEDDFNESRASDEVWS